MAIVDGMQRGRKRSIQDEGKGTDDMFPRVFWLGSVRGWLKIHIRMWDFRRIYRRRAPDTQGTRDMQGAEVSCDF